MRFTYCPICGVKLVNKDIGDEGLLPFVITVLGRISIGLVFVL